MIQAIVLPRWKQTIYDIEVEKIISIIVNPVNAQRITSVGIAVAESWGGGASSLS